MKKSIYILFIIGFGANLCFSQTASDKRFGLTQFDPTKHDRIYRIQVEDYQVVELIDLKNGEFKGTVSHLVWTINRKEIRKDSILQKITIPDSTVKKLFVELKDGGFPSLKDCSEIEKCIIGLDGTTTSFSSINELDENFASYWELESDYYYNQNNVKLPEEVKKARKLISLINREFELDKQFQSFLNRLPKGRYLYSSIVMEKK